jgi:hypothetical protein
MEREVQKYGFMNACQYSTNEFAYIEPYSKVARGRFGLKPLFWNPVTRETSRYPEFSLLEFPVGHLWDASHGRMVCWDPMIYDDPNYHEIDTTDYIDNISESVKELDYDAAMLSDGIGSQILAEFLDRDTLVYHVGTDIPEYVTKKFRNWKVVPKTIRKFNEMEQLHWHLGNNKTLVCGAGIRELFVNNGIMDLSKIANSGINAESPFLNVDFVNLVLGKTDPTKRASALANILNFFQSS